MSKAKYADPIIGTVGDEKATSDHGGEMKLITDDLISFYPEGEQYSKDTYMVNGLSATLHISFFTTER